MAKAAASGGQARPRDKVAELQVPPFSIAAEQAVLGALMLSESAWEHVEGALCAADFYRDDHQAIFAAVERLATAGERRDAVTLAEVMERAGTATPGGLAYLATLAKDTPSAANVAAYAQIVRGKALVRELIEASAAMAHMAYHPAGRDAGDLIDEAERLVFEIAERRARAAQGPRHVRPVLEEALGELERRYLADGTMIGAATGLRDLDALTMGLGAGDLWIVAGRPSMGKSTLAQNIADHVALKDQRAVAIFSLEMPAAHWALRGLSAYGHIPHEQARSGKLDDAAWPRLSNAVAALAKAPIYIDDTPNLSVGEIRSRARKVARSATQGLGLVVVDYLQLMRPSGRGESRNEDVSEFSRGLKALAKELKVPVLALSQLSRQCEQRPNKRPRLSDLRDSGALEQDADVVVFIYRDEKYNKESPDKGLAELIVDKQRNGPTGTVRVAFRAEYLRFEGLSWDGEGD